MSSFWTSKLHLQKLQTKTQNVGSVESVHWRPCELLRTGAINLTQGSFALNPRLQVIAMAFNVISIYSLQMEILTSIHSLSRQPTQAMDSAAISPKVCAPPSAPLARRRCLQCLESTKFAMSIEEYTYLVEPYRTASMILPLPLPVMLLRYYRFRRSA